jgi:hypothetical protein
MKCGIENHSMDISSVHPGEVSRLSFVNGRKTEAESDLDCGCLDDTTHRVADRGRESTSSSVAGIHHSLMCRATNCLTESHHSKKLLMALVEEGDSGRGHLILPGGAKRREWKKTDIKRSKGASSDATHRWTIERESSSSR